ncbi:hypothetical protein JXJ21_19605 [candidate division KSB1 bacterium]|nr:hypothetical protein [candidate division KSB1 bacterium]
MRSISNFSLMLVFLMAMAVNSQAEGDAGYAGAFLRMGIGARPKSMGNAFTAVVNGVYAGYYNPGAIPRCDYKEITFNYSVLALDRSFNHIGLSIPLRPQSQSGEKGVFNAGLHLGWVYAGVDNIDGRDSNGQHIGMFRNSENAFFFGFAIQPHSMVSVGLVAKVLYNQFPEVTKKDESLTSKGLGFDFGVLVTPLPGLSAGIALKDVRSQYSWNTESVWERGTSTYDHFPKIWRVGIAWQTFADKLLLSADFEKNDKQSAKIHLGTEYAFAKKLFLRAGMNHSEPAFGFGYLFKVWKLDSLLDYAYIYDEVAPAGEHVFSWAFRL